MSNIKYTPEQIEWLKQQEGRTRLEIKNGFNDRFGTKLSKDAMTAKLKRLKIKTSRPKNYDVNPEQTQYLKEIIPMRSNAEVARMLNKKFNTEVTTEWVRTWKGNRGIKSGIDTRFNSVNNVKNDMYKIGDEVTSIDGYISVKLAQGKWELKHRLVWEQAHGKVPKGHKIHFKNGDTTDCSLSNLVVLSPQEVGATVGQKIVNQGMEYRETGFLMAKLSTKLKNLGGKSSENNIRTSS